MKANQIEKTSHLTKPRFKSASRLILLPVFLVPFIVSCQSTLQKQSPAIALQEKPSLVIPSKNLSDSEQARQDRPVKQKNARSSAKRSRAVKKKDQKSVLAQHNQSAKHETSLLDDHLSFSGDEKNAQPVPAEQIVSSNDRQNLDVVDESLLLCTDSVYYNSWVEQFDNDWLGKNGSLYSSKADRDAALSQARTNEFIHIVYPSVEKTGFDFPVVINSDVLQWINYFRGTGKKSFVVWLKRSLALKPQLEKILTKYGLPKDLVYLSMIESGYSPKALSYAGAVGLWQFMPATGKEYGLKINHYVDERRSIEKSTEAAAAYLTDLYTLFGSWHLAAASYNVGPGRVQKTLRSYGEDSTFFDLTSMGVVNRQTADYVPKLIAAMIIAKNPEKFGFDVGDARPQQTRSVPVTRSLSLADLAQALKVKKSVLEGLNPELRLGVTPPPGVSGGAFLLHVPASTYEQALLAVHSLPEVHRTREIASSSRTRIKKRESLASFAARHKVSLVSLLEANNGLKGRSHVDRGQVIMIPSVKVSQTPKFSSLNSKNSAKAKKTSVSAKKPGKLSLHKGKRVSKVSSKKSSSHHKKAVHKKRPALNKKR